MKIKKRSRIRTPLVKEETRSYAAIRIASSQRGANPQLTPCHTTGGTSPPNTISAPAYPSTYATAFFVSTSLAAATRANTAIMTVVVAILLANVGTSIMIRNGSRRAMAAEMTASQRRSVARQGETSSGAYGRRVMCFSKAAAEGSEAVLEGEEAPLRAIRPPSSRSWASRVSVVAMRKGLFVVDVRREAVELM